MQKEARILAEYWEFITKVFVPACWKMGLQYVFLTLLIAGVFEKNKKVEIRRDWDEFNFWKDR